ncbi:MAG: DUF3426 domain-containing protein, partial [Magnetococcales bacterium]|nr:DUF3426 domain-containing protein [Magnetococcales bacterium]
EVSLDDLDLDEEADEVGLDDLDLDEEADEVGLDDLDLDEEADEVGLDDLDLDEEADEVGLDDITDEEASLDDLDLDDVADDSDSLLEDLAAAEGDDDDLDGLDEDFDEGDDLLDDSVDETEVASLTDDVEVDDFQDMPDDIADIDDDMDDDLGDDMDDDGVLDDLMGDMDDDGLAEIDESFGDEGDDDAFLGGEDDDFDLGEGDGSGPDGLEEIDLDDETILALDRDDEESLGLDDIMEDEEDAPTVLASEMESEPEEDFLASVVEEEVPLVIDDDEPPTELVELDPSPPIEEEPVTLALTEDEHFEEANGIVDEDEASPRGSRGNKAPWIIAALLVLTMMAGMLQRTSTIEYLLHDWGSVYRIQDVIGKWRQYDYGAVLMVEGSLYNTTKLSHNLRMVRVSLMDENNQAVVSASVVPGRVLGEQDLESGEEALRKMMQLQGDTRRLDVAKARPQKDVPFQVVFINPPENVVRYQVDLDNMEQGTKKIGTGTRNFMGRF